MTIHEMYEQQEMYGVRSLQSSIEEGTCWHLEGSYGRLAMRCLKLGVCFLPDVQKKDAYGNIVPARSMVEPCTTGTLENAERFWSNLEPEQEEWLVETFGDYE